jgi:hypothetical protein
MACYNRVCADSPRLDENLGNECRKVDGEKQILVVARPLLHAAKTRKQGRARGFQPLRRVAWRSVHYVASGDRGHTKVLSVKDYTGFVRKKPEFGVRMYL